VKSRQRLEYGRLAEVLAERGIVDARAIQDALQFSQRGGPPFTEALVTANLVADWELSRLVCEIYGLPFLTVEIADPNPKALAGLDHAFFLKECIVPLSRHGNVLSVLMPALSTTEILDTLATQHGLSILPICGTVRANRVWLEQKLAAPASTSSPAPALPAPATGPGSTDWSNHFDEADAAVLLDLKPLTDDQQDGG
jgi:hypothetical protein